jgi:hypothetical protein
MGAGDHEYWLPSWPVSQLTKAFYPAIPTTIAGRGPGQELVAVPEVR